MVKPEMDYYIAIFMGGLILCLMGMIFQKIVKEPVTGKSVVRDFLVGLGVVGSIFYAYPDSLAHIGLNSLKDDLELQIG
jgi:hypothetical protein